MERPDMTHLAMVSSSKKPLKKGKCKKRKQDNDASHNGQKEENKMQCHFYHHFRKWNIRGNRGY